MLSSKTKIEADAPCRVTYRTPTLGGILVVIVNLTNGENPRLLTFIDGRDGRKPISMFFDDMLVYIEDAKERLK